MPNATDATVTYTGISADTLEDLKQKLAEAEWTLWKPAPGPKSGLDLSWMS